MATKNRRTAIDIEISNRQIKLLTKERNKHSSTKQLILRIDIILLSHAGQTNSSIAVELSTTLKTVRNWRGRWALNYPKLQLFEKGKDGEGVSDLALNRYIVSILKDLARSGVPKKFSAAQEQQIVALACEKPSEHGVEMTDWTHEMLSKTAIAKNIVSTISSSQVGRILKNKSTSTAEI